MSKQDAGRKGGLTTYSRHGAAHMAKIGRHGAAVTWARYNLIPWGTSQYAMVDRATGVVVAVR